MCRASLIRQFWRESYVPVFVKEFVLPIAAALAVYLITSATGFDWQQRGSGALAIFFAAFFVAHTMNKQEKPHTSPPAKDNDKKMKEDDIPKIPPGSVVSFNQSGGITAGHVTMTGPGPVRVSFSSISENQPENTPDGKTIFTSRFRISLSASVPEFIVSVAAPSLIDLELIPEGGTGILAASISPAKDGRGQESLSNAIGGYFLRVHSKNREEFQIVYQCNGVECVGP